MANETVHIVGTVERGLFFDVLIVTGPNGRKRRIPMKRLEEHRFRVKRGCGGRRQHRSRP